MDNLPTVILEAMAAGLPVVSTTIAGVPEMVTAGVSGELVPPNEPVALAEAMAGLLTDMERSREYGARGREIAKDKFSLQKNIAAFAAILIESGAAATENNPE